MARSNTTEAPTIPGTGLVWDYIPDGPTIPDIQDELGPWFVDPQVIETYLVTAADIQTMKRLTSQDHPVNQDIRTRWLAEMWRDRSGQAPETDPTTLTVQLTGEQPSQTTQDWIARLHSTTRASKEALFAHAQCLGHAFEAYHRAKDAANREQASRRQHTCSWCGEYQPGQGLKCKTCELALEWEKLRRAADSPQGQKAIKKVQAAAKD